MGYQDSERNFVLQTFPVEFSDPRWGGTNLICPCCGSDYLHHSSVEIWQRKEDQEKGTYISSSREETTVNTDHSMVDCPSSRRDAVSITFYCEECPNIIRLDMTQHKGCTYMEWRWLRKRERAIGSDLMP